MEDDAILRLITAIPSPAAVTRDGRESISNGLFQRIEGRAIFFPDDNQSFSTLSDALPFIRSIGHTRSDCHTIRCDIPTDSDLLKFTLSVDEIKDTGGLTPEFLIILTDITNQQNEIRGLESQLETYWLIGELSSFLLHSGDTDSILHQALSWIGGMMGLDRIMILEHHETRATPERIQKRYVWQNRSGRGTFHTDEPGTGYERPYLEAYSDLSEGKTVIIEGFQNDKEGSGTDPVSQLRSYIIIPITTRYEFSGIFSFEKTTPDIHWLEKEKATISSFASIVGQFIQRTRTLSRLHYNEALLSAMAGSSPLGFFVVDNRTDAILYANHQFCSLWGLESVCDDIRSAKLKNMDIIPYCIPLLSDPVSFAESCTPLQDEENRICIDDEIPFTDGRTIRRYSTQIRGKNDEYYGRFYIFEDITDKKRALYEIQEREEKLQTIFDNQQPMLIIDAETRKIVNVNNEAVRLIGASPDKIIGKTCHKFICPTERNNCPILDKGQTVDQSERVLLSQSRGLVPVIKTVRPVIQGDKTLLIESFVDISERKRQDENFKKINQCLLSFGPDPLENINKLTELAGELLQGDYAWYRRFEKGIGFLAGRWQINPHPVICDDLTRCIGYDAVQTRSHQVLSFPDVSQSPSTCSDPLVSQYDFTSCVCRTVRVGREDPGTVCVGFTAEVQTTKADHQILSIIGAAIGMEEERRRALDQLNDFAYIVSHDLKAPLRGIASLAQWIQDDYLELLPPEGVENLQLMQSRVHRMQQLIDGVLEYSRIGRVRKKKEDISLRPLVQEIIDILTIPKTFRIKIPDTMPVIRSDRTQISQVFENLISNAVKYAGRDDALIEVLAGEIENYHLFGVRDDGRGIDPNNHQRIFQIFQTVGNSDAGSTGIGLSIVKRIVGELGGSIWVESAIGEGSTFYFTIPFNEGDAAE